MMERGKSSKHVKKEERNEMIQCVNRLEKEKKEFPKS